MYVGLRAWREIWGLGFRISGGSVAVNVFCCLCSQASLSSLPFSSISIIWVLPPLSNSWIIFIIKIY